MRCSASTLLAAVTLSATVVHGAQAAEQASLKSIVDGAIRPVMEHYGIPGMAVGVITPDAEMIFDYGVASKESGKPVTRETLFEVGSVSKTFTATLASYAAEEGDLSLSDPVAKYLPSLKGSSFGGLSLLELGTHMSGSLPLQVPDAVADDEQLIDYLRHWKPEHEPDAYRSYSNVSIGMLGLITAKSMKGDFATLMRDKVFGPLGLHHTYLHVPDAEQKNYAQGYTKKGQPIRVAPGLLDTEAYGVRTTAADMSRFVAANLKMRDIGGPLGRAIAATHTGYFKVGPMVQDLIWEQYPHPAPLEDLLEGNSSEMGLKPNPAQRIEPPLKPQEDALLDKTGSTNGFRAYVAFIPSRKLGIVMLANRYYPNEARVKAAYAILSRLDGARPSSD
ncbi:MAG: class C beta-lactamase [Pararhizobium sp.]